MRSSAHVSIGSSLSRLGLRSVLGVGLLAFLSASPAWAAPPLESRDQLIQRAQPAAGYSYWWGHGCWRTDGQDRGSCSGSCPSCTHGGSKGADCSGFVGKVWQVPNASPVTQDSHPYSTWNFENQSDHWIHKDRGSCTRGDALVYNTDGHGHIVLFESGDPWGWAWTYEARGCSYGIVHNSRSIGSSYVCIERHNLGQGTDESGCTQQQRQNCAAFGCHCVDGECNGGYCPGTGCTAQQAANCGAFGCNCVDGECNGGYCDGTGCTAKETNDCAAFGCGCVDHACSGGYCPGTGCTAKKTNDCGAFGCSCVDQNCNGGYCDGSGCTAKEITDCGGFGVNCVDHQCSGGYGEGSGCTAKEISDCGAFGCGCVDHQCGGGFCEGSGCTARQTLDCDDQDRPCEVGECVQPSEYCTVGVEHATCLPDGQLAHCTDQGLIDRVEECPGGQYCQQGACVANACEPDCAGRACGPDPICGRACGTCPANQVCDEAGRCVNGDCEEDCLGRQCGPDPRCGQSCGDCPEGSSCSAGGACILDADSERGILTGLVRSPADEGGEPGEPVRDARVWLETGLEATGFPDGRFRFVLDPGEYQVNAEAEGYAAGRSTCQVEADMETECDVVLLDADSGHAGPDGGGDHGKDAVVSGGCASTGGRGSPALALLLVLALFLTRLRVASDE